QRSRGIRADSSPGASSAVDLAAFDQGAFEPPMMSLGCGDFNRDGCPEAAVRLIEPRAETLNSVGGCRPQTRGAKPSACFCAAQPSGRATLLVSNDCTVSSGGWQPSTIRSTISGARKASRSSRLTYLATPSRLASSTIEG